jgi:radical SAM superfamily enzyme YgiQ (UPF0313 family)
MKRLLVVNPPSKDKTINRDMAGGLGYSAGEGVVLPPIDLLNIVTTLKKNKYKVFFIDAIAERIDNRKYFLDFIEENKINTVILGLSLPTLTEDIGFGKYLKNNLSGLRVVYKTGINYKQILEKVIRESGVEMVIFSECDLTIVDYLDGKRNSGSCVRNGFKIIFNPMSQLERVNNINDLPIPAREETKIDLYKYVLLPGVVTTMQTSRGCPYPCGIYCPYPLVQGNMWRSMSVARIIKELRVIYRMGITSILFRDATFTLDQTRIIKLCNQIIKNNLIICWWCETRINVLSTELLIRMKKAGCIGINVGVETLDQEMIINHGKPGVTLESVKKIRLAAKEVGIKLHFLMIIGLPDENLRTITNTFEYLIQLKPESVGFSIITPYPGTEMFDKAINSGLINDFDWNKFNGSISNMRTKYLSSFDIGILKKMLLLTAFSMDKPILIAVPIIICVRVVLNLWKVLRRE